MPKADSKEYEELVCDALREENPDISFEYNVKRHGLLTGIPRQIDILAHSEHMGQPMTTVIDCKHYSSKVDINDVGSFITFLNDVRVDLGILVTQTGFTSGAKTLAETSRIKLEIRNIHELRAMKLSFDFCEVCEGDEDHSPPVIDWGRCENVKVVSKGGPIAGCCSWCNGLNLRCSVCGAITGVAEGNYADSVGCTGGCGVEFRVEEKHIEKGLYELKITAERSSKGV